MNCPKCKNPIEETSIVCEWCGAECVHQDVQTSTLDAQLIEVLSKNNSQNANKASKYTNQAVELYHKTTGKSKWESRYYVIRLNFFRIHKFATESVWEKEWAKIKRQMKIVPWIQGLVFASLMTLFNLFTNNNTYGYEMLIQFLFTFIFFGGAMFFGMCFYPLRQYKKFGF